MGKKMSGLLKRTVRTSGPIGEPAVRRANVNDGKEK